MSVRTKPPFRADHVGSLLRPGELLKAREESAAGRLGDAQLRELEDECIRAAIALQADAGLRSATDGEMRRASWHMDFIYRLGGIVKVEDDLKVRFQGEDGEIEFSPAGIRVAERIGLDETIFGTDFEFLRDEVGPGITPKQTIPSPNMVYYRGGRAAVDEAVYPELDPFWVDLGAAYAEEVRRLHELGCRYLQLDDTSLAYLNDPAHREELSARGDDPDAMLTTFIETFNRSIADRPEGMTITTHLCRGNFRSSWAAEGGYETVAERLFGQLGVDGFFLEYDDERSGGFEPLRFVPADKVVVLGLVTTKRPGLEAKDELKRRVEEAARFIDLEQLCLSPQCGFSSTLEGNALSVDEERAKLALVVETAAEIWG
jgi:5-methyltetrahydropteroyltriglutamate--homocysteine methyltransferase